MVSTFLVLAALGVAIFAGPVIRLIAAPEFHSAAQAVPYFAFAATFQCLVLFTEFSFYVKDKTGWITWINYAIALIITILYLVLIPSLGFVGAAQALMIATGIHFLIIHFTAKRHYDMGLRLRPLLFYLTVAFAATSLAYYLDTTDVLKDLAVKAAIYLGSCAIIGGYLLTHPRVREMASRWLFKAGEIKAHL